MFGSILHRMILWELTKVFLMSLVGITGIMLMAGIIAEASQRGLGPAQVLAAIPLLVPSTLPYTIAATTLFATCVVYGRLAADNEILAIRAAGINLLTVVKPAVVLGVSMSAVTLALSYDFIPYTHRLLCSLAFRDVEELLYSALKQQHTISHPQLPYAMYVRGVKGKKLLWPVVKRKGAQGEIDYVAYAREAELIVHMAKHKLLVHMKRGIVAGEDGSRAYFEDKVWELELPTDLGKAQQMRPRDMLWAEIGQRRARWEEERTSTLAAIAATESLITTAPFDLSGHLSTLNAKRQQCESQIRALDVEYQIRPALSIGCLCFILVGCPVGIWFNRSDYLSAFITCFLPIVFIYYPVLLCGTGMAKNGRFEIIPLIWGSDALVGLTGIVLFWRLLRN